ncbi:ABC transporter ATP-binding protein [Cyanobium sp. La Preciosa 7G6]|uniref:ABC transporter ATP-binding protein n=1 Tax=Cyanobium sp. La Preciosa 7G6 TaxID=2823715 RepID=UPI0020CDB039|nr:ABC transporter ATP-binding protein [Cyanobium sp. La Preciosa 7G6]MCP9835107.1 ABC transporter ATP-binding protein [Cyanobium sp. La Preciosa 7G6]MCP9937870.1 ABC transporter ATP-binding protein [Cyanobium sp. Aljojuca 7A6]
MDNLTFEIAGDESIAVIGANGAGKSTLLQLLGGIDIPDRGTIDCTGTISWPVGIEGGFQGSLTGRENVTFVSMIYGEKREIDDRIKFVEDFAELGIYFDRPFKTYSSGMKSRLSFGLSMAFPFDYYLIDEITAAGDQKFREKSKRLLLDRKKTSNFLMVDHNLWGLQIHCNRAFLLESGGITEYANVKEAIDIHTKTLLAELAPESGVPHAA